MSAPHLHHFDKKLGNCPWSVSFVMHHISRLLTTNGVVVLIYVFPLCQQIVGRDVMLSRAKHLLADYTLSTVIPREHSDRGNLLAGYALSTLSLVDFEEILRYTQNDNVGAQRCPPLPPKNTNGDRGVAFSISSRGKLIKKLLLCEECLDILILQDVLCLENISTSLL